MITAKELKQRIDSISDPDLRTTLMLLVQLRIDVEENDLDIIIATRLSLSMLENRINEIERRLAAMTPTP